MFKETSHFTFEKVEIVFKNLSKTVLNSFAFNVELFSLMMLPRTIAVLNHSVDFKMSVPDASLRNDDFSEKDLHQLIIDMERFQNCKTVQGIRRCPRYPFLFNFVIILRIFCRPKLAHMNLNEPVLNNIVFTTGKTQWTVAAWVTKDLNGINAFDDFIHIELSIWLDFS